MNRFIQFIKNRGYSLSLVGAGLILLSLLVILGIIPLFGNGIITINVFVQELRDTNGLGTYTFQVKSIAKMVLLGPIHSIICYYMIHPYIDELKQSINDESIQNFNKRKKIARMLEILLLLFIMINTTGHVLHWICDRANSLFHLPNSEYVLDPAFLLIYVADEFIGHAFAHISYFAFLWILVILEYYHPKIESPKSDEWIIIILIAIGIGVVNGHAALLGESALLLLGLSIFGIVIILIINIQQKKKLTRSPMAIAFIIGSTFVIIYDVIMIVLNGLLPYYPFIT